MHSLEPGFPGERSVGQLVPVAGLHRKLMWENQKQSKGYYSARDSPAINVGRKTPREP